MKVIRDNGQQAHKVVDAEALLAAAMGEWEGAEAIYRAALENQAAARNKVNDAQKIFDAAVNDLRGWAPPGSLWKQRGVGVEAQRNEQ